jgi:hypothetical protein
LTWDGAALRLGAERVETVRWTREQRSSVPDLRPGEQVSMHWNWVCDRLDDDRVADLSRGTERQLALTNAWLARRHSPLTGGVRDR